MAAQLYIDAKMLERRGACDWQLQLFRETFGSRRVLVNVANLRKALHAGLDILWPVTDPFWHLSWHSPLEGVAAQLSNEAYEAIDDATKLLPLYLRAAKLWAQIPVRA